jgi:cytochrome d ubiquinol oxidase subunit II
MPSILQIIWFCLEALLIGGYFLFDGFDLGSGVLYPFIAKGEEEKSLVRRTIGPIWDGNEVWLLTAGGALFAAFPPAYATTFSGFYLAIMLVLFGLIARAAGVEFAGIDGGWRGLWNGAFFVGSLLPALLFGVAIGCVVGGIPIAGQTTAAFHAGDYTGFPLFGLLNPFSLCCGVLGLCAMICQGAAWLALKAPKGSAVQARAAKIRPVAIIVCVVLFILTGLLYFASTTPSRLGIALNPNTLCMVLQFVFVVVIVVGAIGALVASKKGSDLWCFLCFCLVPLGLAGLLGASMFPNLVIDSNATSAANMMATITAASPQAGSNDGTLMAMLIIACIGVPLVLIYHIIAYRVFRGREIAKEHE